MMEKRFIIGLLMFFTFLQVSAQDFHFSQFYASPLNLNPALTGSTELSRVGVNYRKQWPGLNYDFNAYSAYFDHYSFDLNSGFGFMVNSFQESNMQINTTDVSLLYSYNLQVADTWNFKFGGQAAWVRRSAQLDNLVFGDQVDLFNRTINQTTIDQIPEFEPNGYLDLSFGALVNNEYFWLGGSAHHVNRPSLSFFPDNEAGFLPMKWSFHGGVNFPLGSRNYFGSKFDNQVSILANYKNQNPFQQLDLSVQMLFGNVIGGLGFRGIPGVRDLPNQDSIIFLFGINLSNGMVIGYSYDFMISKIGFQTQGAHEVSFRYQFLMGDPKSRNQRSRVLKCFNFMM
ncbi:PorP/SprF family type IX secretion system membrane protein [Aquiflexum gelatinilyticum]|uniref:PorP/SprF family type IX secretion system membrane protein n=1 Tax=Aquiflexum gelatinilyticum TaxID=2961943 RepID=UPI00216A254C|nr:PorP/SprF family type IX secretion system membrane protein [Aquiflexum gelatinilyticum]MCS4434626.1 PorP/SprF family type IX secretion system membrane protein [Aquiflexum gelatinilyticum]